ncbi:MAG: PAAR-like domain-containing protein [Paracoccaceae bacterium]
MTEQAAPQALADNALDDVAAAAGASPMQTAIFPDVLKTPPPPSPVPIPYPNVPNSADQSRGFRTKDS